MSTQITLTFEELAVLRRKTEAVSNLLQRQVLQHLETLRSLFAPETILGRLDSDRELTVTNKLVSELKEAYKPFIGKPLDLPRDFDTQMLLQVGGRLELTRIDYMLEPSAGGRSKKVLMSAPMQWYLTYRSSYNVNQLRQVIAGQEEKRVQQIQQFVLNALVLALLVERNDGLRELFSALRYKLEITRVAEFNGLPLVTIAAPLASFRPADDLILAATEFSGIPAFIELLDMTSLQEMQDPLKVKIEQLLAGA